MRVLCARYKRVNSQTLPAKRVRSQLPSTKAACTPWSGRPAQRKRWLWRPPFFHRIFAFPSLYYGLHGKRTRVHNQAARSGKDLLQLQAPTPIPAHKRAMCDRCSGKKHRVYMHFMLVDGWFCQFLEEDLKTPLRRCDWKIVRRLTTAYR